MSTPTDPWDALDGGWFYLGREVGDGFDVATLVPGPPPEGPGRPAVGAKESTRPADRDEGSGRHDRAEGSSRPAASAKNSGQALALAFTSEEAAAPFIAAAPPGIELLTVAAEDHRAKEEWLRALIEQGVSTLVFDPPLGAFADATRSTPSIGVQTALGYILSHRRATACL
ncbi:MAG TPA: hypothetical protein VF168_07660 [Trueperaceae bacterium]